jgi:hypothetical protein
MAVAVTSVVVAVGFDVVDVAALVIAAHFCFCRRCCWCCRSIVFLSLLLLL